MKAKYLLVASIASLLMVSCSQDEATEMLRNNDVRSLTAVVENVSRSAVTDGGSFSWTEGDAISAWNGTKFVTYNFVEDNKFDVDENETDPGTPQGVAFYPAGEHKYTTLSANLPATYASNETTNAIMMAEISGNGPLMFKHLGGLMRFIIKDVPDDVNSVTFIPNGQRITGDFEVKTSGSNKHIEAEATSEQSEVTITLSSDSETQTFYVPLPVGTYSGFELIVGNANYVSEATNTIARGTLLLMPTFRFSDGALFPEGSNTIVLTGDEEASIGVGDGEIVIDAEDSEAAVLNLNYTPSEGDSFLSITDETGNAPGESKATVNVDAPDDATVDELNIDAPTLSVNLASGSYAAVTAKTANNTLRIKSGVTVATLYLNGGSVIIESGATVGEILNADGFSAATYILNEGTITTTPTITNLYYVNSEAELKLRSFAEYGGYYQLTENMALEYPLVVAGAVNIDLNGYNITPKNATMTKVLSTSDALILVRRGGILSLFSENGNGGRIDTGDNESIMGAIKMTDSNDDADAGNAELMMNPGVTIKGYNYGIMGNGNRHGTMITLQGGTIEEGYAVQDNTGIFHPQNGTLSVMGDAVITGYNSAIEMRSGRLEISAGTFKSTGSPLDAQANGSGTTIKAAALAVSQHTTNQDLQVMVNGGTFEGEYALYEEDKQDDSVDKIGVSVNAGTFKGKVYSENCPILVSGGSYTDASAFNYLNSGANVTLGADLTLTAPIKITAITATINLGSYDVIAPSTDAFEVCGNLPEIGNLTITGNDDAYVKAGTDKANTGSVCAVWAHAGGEVTIEGGHYIVYEDKNGKRNDCIYAGSNANQTYGVITINGGSFEYGSETGTDNDYNGHRFLLNCADTQPTSSITVNGGSFKNHAPTYEANGVDEVALGTDKAVYVQGTSTVITAAHSGNETWYEVK